MSLRWPDIAGWFRSFGAISWLSLIAVIGVSLAFQASVCPRPVAEHNLKYMTSPDIQMYLQLAKDLGHKDADPMSVLLRTPGFPLYVRFAGAWAGVNWSRVEIGTRDWADTSDDGKKLLVAILSFNRVLGFLIPVLVLLMIYVLTRSAWVGALSSFAYIVDIGSVSYENIALSEIPSLFAFSVSNLAAVFAFRNPTARTCLFYGIGAGCAAVARPEHMLLPCIGVPLLALDAFFQHRAASLKQFACIQLNALAPAVMAIAAFLSACALHNLYVTGHFVYSVAAASTLPNFAAQRFVRLDVTDDNLKILQEQWREELKSDASYAGIKAARKDANLAALNCDMYEYLRLTVRASMLAIRANLSTFLRGAKNRYLIAWSESFEDIKNPEAPERLKDSPFKTLCRDDGRLLLGRHSLLGFLVLASVAFALLKGAGPRLSLAYLALVVLVGSFLCEVIDVGDIFRHTVNYRTYANAVSLMGIGLLCQVHARVARQALCSSRTKTRDAQATDGLDS